MNEGNRVYSLGYDPLLDNAADAVSPCWLDRHGFEHMCFHPRSSSRGVANLFQCKSLQHLTLEFSACGEVGMAADLEAALRSCLDCDIVVMGDAAFSEDNQDTKFFWTVKALEILGCHIL